MTELLYYNDIDTDHFHAEVVSAVQTDTGLDLTLSRTYFYPEGGGQPADTGTIGGHQVAAVRKNDGIVSHSLKYCKEAGEWPAVGQTVEGHVNMNHRLDYMQQHSGQHIISASMMKTREIATVSVHQGEEYTSIETGEKDIPADVIYEIEAEANRVINSNIPILSHWTDKEGLSTFNLRRPSKHEHNIRIIEIPKVDCVACGGLHLKTTGEIGLIKYIRQEKIRGHVRTFWKIGGRAVTDYREKTIIVNELCRHHSAQQNEILDKTEAAVQIAADLNFEYGKLQREYAELLIEKLTADAKRTSKGAMLILSTVENKDRRFIENLMKQFAARPEPLIALIFNKTGDKLTWAAACSVADCEKDEIFDFNTFRKVYLPIIDGKGGGKPPIWQGVAQKPEGIQEMIEKLKYF
jgi:alanyl-tRNA synthetase